jgi:multidrug resistance efflux pump
MLNISNESIQKSLPEENFKSFEKTSISKSSRDFTRWLGATLLLILIFLFLPWTQNIQSKGKVTTLRPEQRPQTIQSTIEGRIEKWYVREGDTVRRGDTIVWLSEIKTDYFDPQIVERTQQQADAKSSSVAAYSDKVTALSAQITALENELVQKNTQLKNKIRQSRLKIISDSIDYRRAVQDDSIAHIQLRRTEQLKKEGIKSQADIEDKKFKTQETRAKVVATQNKLEQSRQDLLIARAELQAVAAENAQKIAKAQSDIASTQSDKFGAVADVSKLNIQAANYQQRQNLYFTLAPQDGIITKVATPGIGENIKEGESIVSIMPKQYDLAVEMYVKPIDFPLISLHQRVFFLFDGWPSIVFSGWPGYSFGTFYGEVWAIDNVISDNGEYRILVKPAGSKSWPTALRPGSGAQGIALLKDVPLWYEVWRKLNGFPAEYYQSKEGKTEEIPKMKAPIKSLK